MKNGREEAVLALTRLLCDKILPSEGPYDFARPNWVQGCRHSILPGWKPRLLPTLACDQLERLDRNHVLFVSSGRLLAEASLRRHASEELQA
jgi:hypothetical protein